MIYPVGQHFIEVNNLDSRRDIAEAQLPNHFSTVLVYSFHKVYFFHLLGANRQKIFAERKQNLRRFVRFGTICTI